MHLLKLYYLPIIRQLKHTFLNKFSDTKTPRETPEHVRPNAREAVTMASA